MKSKELEKGIKRFNKAFEANLKQLVPVREKGPQPPPFGALKESIKTYAEQRGDTFDSGVEMLYYGQYVNDGTYKMAAQPFINDAWAETKLNTYIDKNVEKYLDEQFDKVFEK